MSRAGRAKRRFVRHDFASSRQRSGHYRRKLHAFEAQVKVSALVSAWPPLAAPPASAAPDRVEAAARVARVEQIVARHLDAVWRTARDLGVPDADRQDVVQEVMVVCVRRLRDIDPDRERAFLLATTARVVSNWRRARRRRPAEPVDAVDELGAAALHGREAPRGPAEQLERKRALCVVQAALADMTEAQRVAFTLFEIEGLTAREIAEQLGLTEPVVFARVQRARAVFQRHVERLRGSPETRRPR